ncbi:MAG: MCE family protein [Chloroflexi bacterium]|nr:MAG: MCE family protein [Chloroflexota bacterium]
MSGTGRRSVVNPTVAGIAAGIVIAFIVLVMGWININSAAPWSRTHTLTMQVSDADGIGGTSDVRIAGRLVGQVTDIASHGSYSSVVFHVDDSEWPLPADTSASIRLATLLGQKYVELQPGHDKQRHLADNATIGLSATRPVVDFDQILNAFDQPTRTALTDLLKTGAGALQGQEGTLQALLPDLRDLSQHSVVPTQELATRDPELNRILINLGTTADQLARSRDDLAGVMDNLNSVTGALAAHQDALRGQIRNVDALNRTTDAVLGGNGAQQLQAALQRLNGVVHQGNQLFHSIYPQTLTFSQPMPAFKGQTPADATIKLVYGIGDATSQSDANGYFLREFLDTNVPDVLGHTSAPGQPPQSANSSTIPTLPSLPSLPTIPKPPALPTVPSPSLPTVPAPSLPPAPGGGSSGNGAPLPSLPPVPGANGLFGDDGYSWSGGTTLADYYSFLRTGGPS